MAATPRGRPADPAVLFRYGEMIRNVMGDLVEAKEPWNRPEEWKWLIAYNCAFKAEIYLKCVRAAETGLVREGHDLLILFEDLGLPAQRAIRKHYARIIKEENVRRVIARAAKSRGEDPDEVIGFDSALKRSKDAFKVLRYAYEGRPCDSFADHIGEAVRATILELYPQVAANGDRGH
jgi:hypothetical protein